MFRTIIVCRLNIVPQVFYDVLKQRITILLIFVDPSAIYVIRQRPSIDDAIVFLKYKPSSNADPTKRSDPAKQPKDNASFVL